MRVSIFTAAAVFLCGVLAGPVAKPDPSPSPFPEPAPETTEVTSSELIDRAEDGQLVKRARESFHMLNCGGPPYVYSILIYCPDDSNCRHQPDLNNQVSWGYVYTWEGAANLRTFLTGVAFRWQIRSDAQSQPNFSEVGTASNDFHNDYKVYKDNKNAYYTDSAGRTCYSIYYVLR